MKILLTVRVGLTVAKEPEEFQGAFGALWTDSESFAVNGKQIAVGTGILLRKHDVIEQAETRTSDAILYTLSNATDAAAVNVDSDDFAALDVPSGPTLLRLDQVTFPPGATAYRHVHSGGGFRALVSGELEVNGDDHSNVMHTGDAWFEPANTPVRAVASQKFDKTRFIRFMVLPVDYHAKPSIKILDEADALKPRLQTTHRFFDEIIQLDEG